MLPKLMLKETYCLQKRCIWITLKILQVDFSPTFKPELSLSQDSPGVVDIGALLLVGLHPSDIVNATFEETASGDN